MGSSGSSEHLGQSFIQVENPTTVECGAVTGVVHLQLHQGIEIKHLFLRFKGREKTHVLERRTRTEYDLNGKSKQVHYTVPVNSKVTIIRADQPLYTVSDNFLSPGQYSFPFAIEIPPGLPGSFEMPNHGSQYGSIQYKLKFEAKLQSGEKIKSSTPLRIIEKTDAQIQHTEVKKTCRIVTWCCRGKGDLTMTLSLDKLAFMLTETPSASIQIDNSQCQIAITRLQGTLVQRVCLKDNNGHRHIVQNHLGTVQDVGVPARQALLSSDTRKLYISMDQAAIEMISSSQSVEGRLIECVYLFNVEANMDGSCMCCGDRTEVEHPIKFFDQRLQPPPLPQAPPNWNPMTFPEVSLDYKGFNTYAPPN